MKNKSIVLLCSLLLLPVAGWSIEYSVKSTAPHSLGVSKTAVTADGLEFTLDGPESLTQPQENQVQVLLQTFGAWKDVKIKSLKIQVTNAQSEAVIVPVSLDVGGVDAGPYMPSGMWFIARDYLEFDFRLAVKNVFVRMQGGFFDFSEFKNRLKEAIDNPVAYVQKNDPLYLFNKMSEMQKTITDLQAKTIALQTDLATLQYAGTALANRDFFGGMHALDAAEIDKVLKLKTATPDKLRKAIFADYKAQGGKLSESEVYLVMGVYFKDFSN